MKEQFTDALHSSDMRLRVKQARPSDLDDAVRHAVELEAYNRAERRKTEGEGYFRSANTNETRPDSQSDCSLEELTNTLKLIQDVLKLLKTHTNKKTEFRGYRPQGERRPFPSAQPYPRAQTSPDVLSKTWT